MQFPGFVDLQINGYKGVDFSGEKLTEQDFHFACQEIIRSGTVVFLPTVITSSAEIYQKNLKLIASVIKHKPFSMHIPGIHVEGPFISKEDGARGAHNKDWVRTPDIQFFDQLFRWSEGKIKLITVSAELNDADELCRHATKLGVRVSLGHQMANEADLEKMVKAGAVSLTHLGNGVPIQLHRHSNPIWAGMGNDELKAMIITDGHHLPPSLIKSIIRTKGISNVIVASDASPVAGLPPGKYNTLGNDAILDPSGKLYNPDSGYLVGSSSTMIDCMNYLLDLDILSTSQLLELGFFNPLKLIGSDAAYYHRNFKPKLRLEDKFILIN
jgi:N-acetylglucosamine-6-phosphate deacetylase